MSTKQLVVGGQFKTLMNNWLTEKDGLELLRDLRSFNGVTAENIDSLRSNLEPLYNNPEFGQLVRYLAEHGWESQDAVNA